MTLTPEQRIRLNLSKLPPWDEDEVVLVPAFVFAELVGIAEQNFDSPDDMPEREAAYMEFVCTLLAVQAPTTWRWFREREAVLSAWEKTL